MDVGIFKSNQRRLTLWILIPLFITVGFGLSSYALRQQSEWQLSRTQILATMLPKLATAKENASVLMSEFEGIENQRIESSDEFISFLQSAAGRSGFTVDSLKVDRRISVDNGNMPVLVARVKGMGDYLAIERFVGDVSSSQHLLSASALNLSQSSRVNQSMGCRAEITFELFLFASSGGTH